MEVEKLEDLLARRQAHLHRYGTYTFNQIIKLLDRVDSRLTIRIDEKISKLTDREQAEFLRGNYSTKRLVALRENIRELAAEVRKITSTVVGNNGKELAEYEVEATLRALPLMGIDTLGTTVTSAQAYAAATSRPMLGRHVRDHIKDLDADYRKRLFAEIREGFLSGEGVSSIVRQLRDEAQPTRNRQIETIVRTSLNHIANVASEFAMAAAGVERVKWVSTLDGRTSKICAARDGKVYDKDKGPRPPAHPNCRSRVRPYEPGEGGTRPFVRDDRPVSKIPKSQRDDKIGRVRQSTTFAKWFDRQPASFKREWLGATRYKLYKKGIKLERFADPRTGREYNLKELRRMDAAAFEEAGL